MNYYIVKVSGREEPNIEGLGVGISKRLLKAMIEDLNEQARWP